MLPKYQATSFAQALLVAPGLCSALPVHPLCALLCLHVNVQGTVRVWAFFTGFLSFLSVSLPSSVPLRTKLSRRAACPMLCCTESLARVWSPTRAQCGGGHLIVL